MINGLAMSTKLQSLATFWQEFSVTDLQANMDEAATEITAR